MKTKTVVEGKIRLRVPSAGKVTDAPVFYNPVMAADRDIGVSLLSLLKPKKALDALAATGVRGLRYKQEARLRDVWLNDINKLAVSLARINARLNGLSVTLVNEDACFLMRHETFDFIDIDPFGSPARFLDSAAASIKQRGIIAITATDTGALYGKFPDVSLRRYGVASLQTDYNRELGLRILATALLFALARYEKTCIPLLAYTRQHYARLICRVEQGRARVDKQLTHIGYVSHCFSCGFRITGVVLKCPICKKPTSFTHVYLGKLNDTTLLHEAGQHAERNGFAEACKILETLARDIDVPFHYDLHYIVEKQKLRKIPKTNAVVEKLWEKGFQAAVSPYSGKAIKTNANFKELLSLLKKWHG